MIHKLDNDKINSTTIFIFHNGHESYHNIVDMDIIDNIDNKIRTPNYTKRLQNSVYTVLNKRIMKEF